MEIASIHFHLQQQMSAAVFRSRICVLLLLVILQTKGSTSFHIQFQRKSAPLTIITRTSIPTSTTQLKLAADTSNAPEVSPPSSIATNNTKVVKSAQQQQQQSDLEVFIADNFDAFYNLLSLNEGIWQTISESDEGCTLFVPSNNVFDKLGSKKIQQLRDQRNLETVQKIGLYHVIIDDAVSGVRLRTEDWTQPAPIDGSPRPITIQALVTLGGEVPVGRSKSGGLLFGLLGAKEDGDIVIGPDARIVRSYKIDGSYVHEVDALLCPIILWRYMDQLRIPGF